MSGVSDLHCVTIPPPPYPLNLFGAFLTLPAFRKVKKKIDKTEYGGAPLMGVDGRDIIAHGSSNSKAIKNAIRVAGEVADHHVNQRIIEELQNF